MSTIKNATANAGKKGFEAPGSTHERILQVLGMTQRPLQSGELQNALGLVTSEASGACKWLTDQGYITSTARRGKPATQREKTAWELADKGRLWVKGRTALAVRGH